MAEEKQAEAREGGERLLKGTIIYKRHDGT